MAQVSYSQRPAEIPFPILLPVRFSQWMLRTKLPRPHSFLSLTMATPLPGDASSRMLVKVMSSMPPETSLPIVIPCAATQVCVPWCQGQ